MSEVEKKAEELADRAGRAMGKYGKHFQMGFLAGVAMDAIGLPQLLQELVDKDKNIKEGRAVDSMWTRGRMKLYELFREAKDNTEIAIATKQYLDGNFYDIRMPIIDLEKDLADAKAEAAKWKANHDNQVKLKHAIMDRPDLKDHASSVMAMAVDLADAKAKCEEQDHEIYLRKQCESDAVEEVLRLRAEFARMGEVVKVCHEIIQTADTTGVMHAPFEVLPDLICRLAASLSALSTPRTPAKEGGEA